jgi:hypothetical protein
MNQFKDVVVFHITQPVSQHLLGMWVDVKNLPIAIKQCQNLGDMPDDRSEHTLKLRSVVIQIVARLRHNRLLNLFRNPGTDAKGDAAICVTATQ